MLLQSIKLLNFRQFVNEEMVFADGNDGKNVTIIIGENGTGKTTFAQAFFWCLYGETEFSDKQMLNKKVASELRQGQEAKVLVQLRLRHGEVEYTITREQTYKKELTNKIKSLNTTFDIAKKDKLGNTSYVKPSLCESEIKQILPRELSRYFFFDGERIEKMSKDIANNKKADDFAEAVKGLLGLNAMFSAIQHLNPKSKNSVLGLYEASYNSQSNEKVKSYTETIEKKNQIISECDEMIEKLRTQIEDATNRKREKSDEIKQYADGERLQKEREELEGKIASAKRIKAQNIKSIAKDFNHSMNSFFSYSLSYRALMMLKDKDFAGKDIPSVDDKTIHYLLNNGVCLCGTCLSEGSLPYNKVKELLEFVPPESIGNRISKFKDETTSRADFDDICQLVSEQLASISSLDDDIDEYNMQIQAINEKLNGDNVREIVRKLNAEIQTCERIISDNERNIMSYSEKKGAAINERDRADSERRNLTLLDANNRKIEIYKSYAEKIYEGLLETYKSSEKEIREKLEATINDVFKHIYQGGLSLTIDEKYHISVYVNDYDGDVETSTAQSISVIFAFITGIIKMARDNRTSEDEDAKLLSSEPYPLVMDAPLSAFDKRRIKTVCESLPTTAEQVVIFIKDTDGDLAETYLGSSIGIRHSLEKLNEFETVLH